MDFNTTLVLAADTGVLSLKIKNFHPHFQYQFL